MIAKIFVGIVVSGLLSGAALSQTTQFVPNASSAPAASTDISASQLAAAKDFVLAIGADKPFASTVEDYKQQIMLGLSQTRPDLVRDLATVLNQIKPEFDKRTDEMLVLTARVYAENFSESELKTLSDFFKSPLGKKYLDRQPRILSDVYARSQVWMTKMSQDMMTRTREEMRKKGHEL